MKKRMNKNQSDREALLSGTFSAVTQSGNEFRSGSIGSNADCVGYLIRSHSHAIAASRLAFERACCFPDLERPSHRPAFSPGALQSPISVRRAR